MNEHKKFRASFSPILFCNARIIMLDISERTISFSLTLLKKERERDLVVTPKFGALFHHYNAAIQKKN